VARHQGRHTLSGAAMVIKPDCQTRAPLSFHRRVKKVLSPVIASLIRITRYPRRNWRRLFAHASLSSELSFPLDGSTVVLGKATVCGTGNVRVGRNVLLYPNLYLETQNIGSIEIGDDVVISSGAHIASMAKVTIGRGSMIGEYASIRDANHLRMSGFHLRDAGYAANEIVIGNEVWIGRGVTILRGVHIGDGATVGANAVVTRDVPARAVVAGVPARRVQSSELTNRGDQAGNGNEIFGSCSEFPGEDEATSFPATRSAIHSESR